jgi:hypothetical protein
MPAQRCHSKASCIRLLLTTVTQGFQGGIQDIQVDIKELRHALYVESPTVLISTEAHGQLRRSTG